MSFKIYTDFESVLKEIQRDGRGSNASYTKKYQKESISRNILAVLLIKLCVLMIDLANQLFFIDKKNTVNESSLKQFLQKNGKEAPQ